MKQINQTNCKNCGAPLEYVHNKRIAKCKYCNTEYHLDDLGRIKEYMVELELFGRRMKFYIESISMEQDCYDTTLLIDSTKTYMRCDPRIKLELVGR